MRTAVIVANAVALAITTGTVEFAGLGQTATKDIVAVAGLVGIAGNTWLAATSAQVRGFVAKMRKP